MRWLVGTMIALLPQAATAVQLSGFYKGSVFCVPNLLLIGASQTSIIFLDFTITRRFHISADETTDNSSFYFNRR